MESVSSSERLSNNVVMVRIDQNLRGRQSLTDCSNRNLKVILPKKDTNKDIRYDGPFHFCFLSSLLRK